MATPWQTVVPAISAGEAVAANVANRAPQANAQRTQYLYDRMQALSAGEALFLHFVNIEEAALPGDVVYYDSTADEYKRAIAAVDYNPTVGWFTIAESSFVVGMVYEKTNNTQGHLVVAGALRNFDLTNAIESGGGSAETAGPYYLSMRNPGKLTLQNPAVSVYVLFNRGDDIFHFMPAPKDMLEHHIHYRYELDAVPAGDHNCLLITDDGVHKVLNPDSNLPGWLPADDAIFNGLAPTGAKFGYNISKHPDLEKVWPPIPVDGVYLERNGNGVPLQGSPCPTAIVDQNGIWWMWECWGAAPWPPELPGCIEESSSSSEAPTSSSSSSEDVCDCKPAMDYLPGHGTTRLDEMTLRLWFTKMVYKTDQSVVTQLDPLSDNEPIVVLDCDGEPASTGKLNLAFDFTKLEEVYPSAGFKVVKDLANAQILRGQAVTGIKPGLKAQIQGIGTEGVDWELDSETGLYHGNLLVGLENLTDVSAGKVDLVALNNVREEYDNVDQFFYLHYPFGRPSDIRGRVNITNLNLSADADPDDLKLAIFLRFVSRQSGALPELTATYRRYPRPTTIQTLPDATDEENFDATSSWDPSVTFTASNQVVEVQMPLIDVVIGDTVDFTLGWAGLLPSALTEGFGVMRYDYQISLVI